MRDLALTLFVLGSLPIAFRSPAYGALLFAWLSIMNPHRLTWGFAYDLPFAMMAALATLAGVLFSRQPKSLPLKGPAGMLLVLFAWMSFTTLFALDASSGPEQWVKIVKIQLMVFVTLYVLHTRKHIHILVCVVIGSVAFYGVKGGIFTLTGGGGERVYGPDGTFISENNALAVAVIMAIPMLNYIRLQYEAWWMRWGLLGAMALCFFSALGSQSRGALVCIAAMFAFFWLKSRKKLLMGVLIVLMIPIGAAVMSDRWETRMQTMETYEEDASVQGRFNAWWMAYNLAKDRPLVGGGFQCYGPAQFARYAPNPTDVHAWHSIYFTMLGEHGFVGLGLFLLLWFTVWRNCSWIVQRTRGNKEWQWAGDLATMTQVSLVGYASGGAFLSLAYYDVPYYMLVAIVLTRALMEKELNLDRPVLWRPKVPPKAAVDVAAGADAGAEAVKQNVVPGRPGRIQPGPAGFAASRGQPTSRSSF